MDATAIAGFNTFRGGLSMAHLTRQPALSPERNASGFQGEVSFISNEQELGEILQSEAVKSCTFYTCRLVRPSFLDLCNLVQAEAIIYFPSSATDLAPELEDAEAVRHACNWVKIPRSFLSPLRTNTAARMPPIRISFATSAARSGKECTRRRSNAQAKALHLLRFNLQ